MMTADCHGAVQFEPFPHCVIDSFLLAGDFDKLVRSYPVCPPASGPTGHTIHRGDPQFDAVMAESPEWRELHEHCQSQQFLDKLVTLYAAEIDASCLVPRSDFQLVDHIESRIEKEALRIANPAHPAEAIFVRFDFMQGMQSYARRPHLDHRRRLATALIYFDSPGPSTYSGGELVLHEVNGAEFRRIPPAANRAVLFPCSERSWHSVAEVTHCLTPRRFVQVSLSSCHDIWPNAQLPPLGAVDRVKAALRRFRS